MKKKKRHRRDVKPSELLPLGPFRQQTRKKTMTVRLVWAGVQA
jgi:hypothetical protein